MQRRARRRARIAKYNTVQCPVGPLARVRLDKMARITLLRRVHSNGVPAVKRNHSLVSCLSRGVQSNSPQPAHCKQQGKYNGAFETKGEIQISPRIINGAIRA
jgi:hypothetical protein